ncbi:hypothetical protein MIM_c16230 [Advenella mimigardefordensis DPN7]|uniref:Uncharacterized protein n=1 Tax=Advenella mimigardefordensis (strain DSM 17166 / LMG 22922 / DPN7) TaxID=1247726 RepID=W0PAI1_ADVMD|nr:hypothetical protein MIM_c16230 [Advenella mimigardefordensis DPN7]
MKGRHVKPRHRSRLDTQHGQALVLGLFLVMLLAVALIYQFGVGQVVGRKARLTHAADAAAYSGALVQARALNMQAYINLTQTAHQVAMAHLVTLGSWSQFAAAQGQQFVTFNPPAHVIGMMFGAQHLAGYAASARALALRDMARTGGQLPRLFAEHDRIVRHVLLAASEAVHQSMQRARDQAITQVLEQNFPQSAVTQTALSSQAGSVAQPATVVPVNYPADRSAPLSWVARNHLEKPYTVRYQPTAGDRRFLEDVVALYDFLDARDHVRRNSWMVQYQCPHLRHELRRRGRTVLDSNGNWQSTDTQSYHALRSNQYIGCYYREYPMGWGWIPGRANMPGADMPYSENAPDHFGEIDFWRWVTQATGWNIFSGSDNPLANSRAVSGKPQWEGGGLVPYYDVRDVYRYRPLGFTITVKQHFTDQPTLVVTASAETFFEPASDKRRYRSEQPGMWHPFWQAHLISNPHKKED